MLHTSYVDNPVALRAKKKYGPNSKSLCKMTVAYLKNKQQHCMLRPSLKPIRSLKRNGCNFSQNLPVFFGKLKSI